MVYLEGREYVAFVSSSQKVDDIAIIQIISCIEEIFFDLEGYEESKNDKDHLDILTNFHKKYLNLLYLDTETREVSRCTEHDLLYDVTNLQEEKKQFFLKKALEQKDEVQNDETVLSDLISKYEHCLEIGYTQNEAINQIYKIIKEQYHNNQVLKDLIQKNYGQ